MQKFIRLLMTLSAGLSLIVALMINLTSQVTSGVLAAASTAPLSAEISAGCSGSVGDTTALINAINTANNTPAVDTIVWGNCVYTLSQAIQTLSGTPEITTTFGKTGLPAITSRIIMGLRFNGLRRLVMSLLAVFD